MADVVELLDEQSPEPSMSRTRQRFTDVSNWRDYAASYAEDLEGYEVVSIKNNICSGARPSYIRATNGGEHRMWFLPVELARQVNHVHNGMLKSLTLCYERVDNKTGHVLSSDGLRWPADVTGAKVTFSDLTEVDYSAFKSDEIIHNVAYNIILSRQIEVQADRDAYLFFSLTYASQLLPLSFIDELRTDVKAVDIASGLQLDYERFFFLFLFVRTAPRIVGEVATPEFYTTCLRFRRMLESWEKRQLVDYDEALYLRAFFELETLTSKPRGGLLYNRVSMLAYNDDCGLDDLLETDGYRELQKDLEKLLEDDEWSPLHSVPAEHRGSEYVFIGEQEYRAPVKCSSRNLSSRNVGVQARLTGKTTCITLFHGKPAVLRVSGETMTLLKIDKAYMLKTMAWVVANNPFYQLADVPNPANGGYESNRLILNAMNMGLFAESGTKWILSQIVYGDVKVSSKSRNRLFRNLAQDEEGVQMNKESRPDFTQQLAAVMSQDRIHLAVASDMFLELEKQGGMWRVQACHSRVHEVTGLGQFRTATSVG